MKLTFVDAGVLIAAARGGNIQAGRAMEISDDPEREFAASPFLLLEVELGLDKLGHRYCTI
ncbi:MAG TPA: hypothetical protein VNN08_10990 [Thermoanaerobaculia bacterium]|nr:hypothetical protein [Thermoanaerobaculia bacterium]